MSLWEEGFAASPAPQGERDLPLLILCTSNRSSVGAKALLRMQSLFNDLWTVPPSSASPSAENAPARSLEAEQLGVKGLLVSPAGCRSSWSR